eukprot:1391748-Amorphochlora_amoeboformis.AAC.2
MACHHFFLCKPWEEASVQNAVSVGNSQLRDEVNQQEKVIRIDWVNLLSGASAYDACAASPNSLLYIGTLHMI